MKNKTIYIIIISLTIIWVSLMYATRDCPNDIEAKACFRRNEIGQTIKDDLYNKYNCNKFYES